jgi:NAD(P)-dependent dehydrogenase (short-subunit alcohol dehydrogenase family)
VALITGADSGIGRAVAIAFAREGADVLISYLNEHDDAKETARWVEQAGRRALLVAGDVRHEGHCIDLVQRAVTGLGRLDVLVNNAAFQATHEDLEELTAEELDRTFRTNIYRTLRSEGPRSRRNLRLLMCTLPRTTRRMSAAQCCWSLVGGRCCRHLCHGHAMSTRDLFTAVP